MPWRGATCALRRRLRLGPPDRDSGGRSNLGSSLIPVTPASLYGISLTIERGRFLALTGANGSGKTTLAKHLVGLLRPDAAAAVRCWATTTRAQSTASWLARWATSSRTRSTSLSRERVADELAYSLRRRLARTDARRVKSLLATFGLEGYETQSLCPEPGAKAAAERGHDGGAGSADPDPGRADLRPGRSRALALHGHPAEPARGGTTISSSPTTCSSWPSTPMRWLF